MPADVAVPARKWIAGSLIAVGVGCLGWCAIVVTQAAMYQRDRTDAPRSGAPRTGTAVDRASA